MVAGIFVWRCGDGELNFVVEMGFGVGNWKGEDDGAVFRIDVADAGGGERLNFSLWVEVDAIVDKFFYFAFDAGKKFSRCVGGAFL